MSKVKSDLRWDEWDEQVNQSAIDDAEAVYRTSKRENTMNDICKGAFMYLKLEPKTSDRKYWEEVYKKANEIRDQYKKIREVL